jgi:hypothetical protein
MRWVRRQFFRESGNERWAQLDRGLASAQI